MSRLSRYVRFLGLTVLLLVVGEPMTARAEPANRDTVLTATSLRAAMLYEGKAGFEQPVPLVAGTRSVPLAFGMSAVVPGLGQAYNKQWVKAGIAFAAEVALIAGYAIWHQKGVDGREAYRGYAHEYWSPVRYAYWLNDYKTYLEDELGTPISSPFISISGEVMSIDFSNSANWSGAERSAVRSLFDQIRTMETNVYHPETGATFSHKLPYFGEQQYYELVGKYFQFAPGWEDYQFILDADGNPTWIDADGNFVASIDPEETGVNGGKVNVSDRFFDYAQDHGDANDYLLRASRLTVVFFANHFISAIDAALFAKLHNNRLEASVNMTYNQFGEPQPVAKLTYSF
ncbi:MAG TPA: DUF5683 domain-containing protein [Rhodothermales bacterium]|nr:DUF5683 domain-containing protein [Rhodothermales bacterium]